MNNKWLWYPGDFDFLLYYKLMHKRTYRNKIVVPSWRVDDVYHSVTFKRFFKIDKPISIQIKVSGEFTVFLDTQFNSIKHDNGFVEIPASARCIIVMVHNPVGLPCILVKGGENTGFEGDWICNCGTYEWINTEWRDFCDENLNPNDYKLPTRRKDYVSKEKVDGGVLYDFGNNMMAYTVLRSDESLAGKIFYGETKEEALDKLSCETYDEYVIEQGEFATKFTKGYRYLFLENDKVDVYALEEYRDIVNLGNFACDQELINKLYMISCNTLFLNSKEFILDGIKRDRWVWAGDVYACLNYNYYSFFDIDLVESSIFVLFGKYKPEMHVNYIPEYSLFLLLSVYEHFVYTGRKSFVEKIINKAIDLMDFCLDGCDSDGWFIKNHDSEWVFIDWANIDENEKCGRVTFEQIVLLQALKSMSKLCELTGKKSQAEKYKNIFNRQYDKLFDEFWIDDDNCFTFAKYNGGYSKANTIYAEIFALKYDLLPKEKRDFAIRKILSGEAQKITTPYMKFHELDCLGKEGKVKELVYEMKRYFGPLVKSGAQTIWEEISPEDSEHSIVSVGLGNRHGMSRAHAWGSGAIYLLGKYVAGVRPAIDGYSSGVIIRPNLFALDQFNATVPVSTNSKVEIKFNNGILEVFSDCDAILELPSGYKITEVVDFNTTEDNFKQYKISQGIKYSFLIKN